MARRGFSWVVVAMLLVGASTASAGNATDELADAVRKAEIAFAKTMADRDHEAFVAFLAQETVFFAGDTELRGEAAVAEAWKRFFEGPDAPFSWHPEVVSVLDSGTLGLSSGPIFDPAGNRVGTYNSVWRRKGDGDWEIVFDRGCPRCGNDE